MNQKNINIIHGSRGKGGTRASNQVVQWKLKASGKSPCLTNLMDEIASKANLRLAFKAVKRNKGAPGIDKMSVMEVKDNLEVILEELETTLKDKSYRPCPVRGVKIPKANGSLRQLGIPTVIDRIVQQAIAQVCDAGHGAEVGDANSLWAELKRSISLDKVALVRELAEGS